jgi:uncharacterized protein with PIN domain
VLSFCTRCRRVAWVGIPVPHVETSREPVAQYVRVNLGGGRSRRDLVSAPVKILMGKVPEDLDRCPSCGAKGLKATTRAKQILSMTRRGR